ncbi:MAG: hypothetical protein RBS17_01590 [Coriobacteriia bacterium]|jgi:hypothetical protein|nr:hypothetical protein [Coriobacteriia bacterium]
MFTIYKGMSNENDSEQIVWCGIDMRTWDEMLCDAFRDNGESYNDVVYTSHYKYENPFWFRRPLYGYMAPDFVVMTKRYLYHPRKVIVERRVKPQMPKDIMLASGEPDLICDDPKTRRVEVWDVVSTPLANGPLP